MYWYRSISILGPCFWKEFSQLRFRFYMKILRFKRFYFSTIFFLPLSGFLFIVALINAFLGLYPTCIGVQFLNLVFHNWLSIWFSAVSIDLHDFFHDSRHTSAIFVLPKSVDVLPIISHCVFRVFDCHFHPVVAPVPHMHLACRPFFLLLPQSLISLKVLSLAKYVHVDSLLFQWMTVSAHSFIYKLFHVCRKSFWFCDNDNSTGKIHFLLASNAFEFFQFSTVPS